MTVTAIESEPKDHLRVVSLAGAGDSAAQELLVRLVRRRVRTISLAILGHVEDAEDAAQVIFMEILRSAESFRGGSLHAWTDRIAVRTAVRHARQRRVRAAYVDGEAQPESLPSVLSELAPVEHAIPRAILEYLAELPEARRTVLVLRHVLGYSIEEVAELTEVSPNTVKDRLLQARRQMRQGIRRDLAKVPAKNRSLP